MRKIDLTPYTVDRGDNHILPFEVKQSIVNILFSDPKLSAQETLVRHAIAEKVRHADRSVLLEDSEYNKVVDAVNAFSGYREDSAEFIVRVLNAEEVSVEESIREHIVYPT